MTILAALVFTTVLLSSIMSQHLDAEDCVVYRDESDIKPHVKEFHERVSTAITPLTSMMSMKLHLASATHNCTILLVAPVLVASCTNGRNSKLFNWPVEVFKQYDTTEIWLQLGDPDDASQIGSYSDDASQAGSYSEDASQVGSYSDDASLTGPSSNLFMVGKLGKHRGRLVIPSSGLTPPVSMHWITVEAAKYYFNCVTGCLLSQAAKTQSGDHSVFLRQGEGSLLITLTYTSDSRGGHHHTANLTSADLGPPAGLRNITLVWDGQVGTIGVLVDGAPVGDLGKYSLLDDSRGVEVEVTAGDGLVAACDPRFQGVAKYPPAGVSPPTSDSGNSSCQTLIVLLVLTALICLAPSFIFAALYYRTYSKVVHLRRRSSNRKTSSTCNIDQGKDLTVTDSPLKDEDCKSASEVTMAMSETVMTPVATPNSLNYQRSKKFVSTKDFVDLELM